jgi:hypothetical protein
MNLCQIGASWTVGIRRGRFQCATPSTALAKREVIEHLKQFAPVVVRARHVLAVHLDTARVA